MRAAKVEIQDPRPENIARFALGSALKNNKRLIVVEDSGLFIEGLSGFPGPYYSFVYETIGLKGILSLLRSSRNRRAYFQSSVAAGSSSLEPQLFIGTVRGRISRSIDRKSTRLNSSHERISYAVFCLKKKRPRPE